MKTFRKIAKIITFVFCLAILQPTLASSIDTSNISNIPFIILNTSDMKPLRAAREETSSPFLKYQQFAIGFDTNITTQQLGRWQNGASKGFDWVLGVCAPGAYSINIIFEPFYLPIGAWLEISNGYENDKVLRYTFRNNKADSILATMPVLSDTLILKLHVSDTTHINSFFSIRKVSVEPQNTSGLKTTYDKWFGKSASCHRDVNCYPDKVVQSSKYSVVRYIFNGTIRCTGILVNNTRQDEKPYVLTAGHCIQSENDASTAIFYFDYESPYCGGADGTIQAISGAKLISRSSNVDFALIEINEPIPYNYRPVYAGWDRSDFIPDSVFALHHPMGDVKKISIDNEAPLKGSYENVFDPNTHWVIPDYDDGTTEIGSSGCPLFDTKGRVIGTLSGGGDTCSQYIYDRYQRFAHSWANYSDDDQQLKKWLDPANKDIQFLNTYDPGESYRETVEELSNYTENATFYSGKRNDGTGYSAGHNKMGQHLFAERFSVNGTKYIDGVLFEPSRVYYATDSAYVVLHIWNSAKPNDAPVYSERIFLFELEQSEVKYFPLADFVKVDYEFFVGFELYYQQPQDTFALAHENINPLGLNSAFTSQANSWVQLSNEYMPLNTSLHLAVRVFDYYPDIQDTSKIDKLPAITIYPNPVADQLQIFIKDFESGRVQIKIYSINGALILQKDIENPEKNIPLNAAYLSRGIYILKVSTKENSITQKFIKL